MGLIVSYILNYWRDNLLSKLRKFLKRLYRKWNQLFFVGSSDVLPGPLTREAELEYLKLSEQGDILAKNKLIEHNLRLVVFLAKKYDNTKIDLEDLVSMGTIGLIKAINTYKLDRNIKLATYASRCIDNEILMFLRKNKKTRGEVSLEESLNYDLDGNELHLKDILGTEPDIVTKAIENEVEKQILLTEINKLEDREKQIMILRYGLFNQEAMTQKDVAQLLGISQSYISRIEKKIIKKLSLTAKI